MAVTVPAVQYGAQRALPAGFITAPLTVGVSLFA